MTYNVGNQQSNIIRKYFLIFFLVMQFSPFTTFALTYLPGATLDPMCLPTDPACLVASGIASTSASGIAISSANPVATSSTLYNLGGTLYWSGGIVGINSSSSVFTNATSSTFQTTILGVGPNYFTSLTGTGLINLNGALTLATTTNTLASASNVLSSTVNGVLATSTLITSATASSSANLFNVLVNGVASTLGTIINSLTQSVTGNVLTSTVNGVAATTSVITSKSLSFATSTSVLTDTVNGIVATSSILANFGNGVFGILGIANGGTATTTQVTNGVNFFDGTKITSGTNLTFNGTNLGLASGGAYQINGVTVTQASTTLNNYFFGNAGNSIMTGISNTAVGNTALISNLTGYSNAAFGTAALYANNSGAGNAAFGVAALTSNTSGFSNTGIGTQALDLNTTGGGNIAVGSTALFNNNGDNNTAIGIRALNQNQSGTQNVGIGFNAGYSVTPDRNSVVDSYMTFLGAQASRAATVASTTALTNATAIGFNAQVGCSNCMVLGNGANVGIGTTTPTYLLDVNGLGHFTSLVDATNFVATSSSATSTFAGGLTVGSQFLVQQGSGNVAIGPALSSFYGKLQVNVGTNQTFVFRSGGVVPTARIEAVNDAINANVPMELVATKFSFAGGGNVGIATTTPLSALAVSGGVSIGANYNIAAPANGLIVQGNIGIGTTTPGSLLSLNNIANFTAATSTFYSTGGINLAAGCFSIAGNCLSLANIGGTTAIANGGTATTTQVTNGVNFFDGTKITSGTALTFSGTTFGTPLFSATQTTGTSTIAAGQGFTVGGSQLVVQQGSGNIGIGTSNPAYKLHVAGVGSVDFALQALDSSSKATLRVINEQGFQNSLTNFASSSAFRYGVPIGNLSDNYADGNNVMYENAGIGNSYFVTNFVVRQTITNAGNIGIGTTTPGSLLSLNNIANFTAATSTFYSTGGINLAAGCFSIAGNCLSLANIGGTTAIANGGTATTTQVTNGVNFFDGTKITSGTALTFSGTTFGTPLFSATQTTGTSTIAAGQGFTVGGSQLVVQQGSGNVGIGTNIPLTALAIQSATWPTITLTKNGIGNWQVGTKVDATNNLDIFFNASNPYFSITNTGNIGIGTTTPAAKLSVNGTIGVGADEIPIKETSFGYTSPTYKVLQLGSSFTPNRSLALNIDPITIVGGSFSGIGNILIASSSILAPNASGTDWMGVLRATNDKVYLGGATNGGELDGSGLVVNGAKVGIGTTTPTAQFSTTGTVRFSTFGAGTLQTDALGNLSSSILNISSGGTATTTQVTNGVNFFDGTKITSGTALTFNGTNLGLASAGVYQINGVTVSQASTTLNNYFFGNAGNSTMTGSGNTANGSLSLLPNTTGSANTANGVQSLFSNTAGSNNTANGYQSLYSNTTGTNNTANGLQSLYSNTTGAYSVANGYQSLFSNTTGNYNVANGANSLRFNTTGNNNTANGQNSLFSNTTGSSNTANGFQTLYSNTTGSNNTANGQNSLFSNTTGTQNTANGQNSLYANTTGIYNTASGFSALYSNTTGTNNTSNGYQAGFGAASGDTNSVIDTNSTFLGAFASRAASVASTTALTNATAIGFNAQVGCSNCMVLGNGANVGIGTTSPGSLLTVAGTAYATGFFNTVGATGGYSIDNIPVLSASSTNFSTLVGKFAAANLKSSAVNNTALGYNALSTATSSSNNTALGYQSLAFDTSGYQNTAVGSLSLYQNTTGYWNTTVGYGALGSNISGNENIGIGRSSLANNTTGSNSVAIGDYALSSNTTSGSMVAIGYSALQNNTTGYNNTAVGNYSGNGLTTGYGNTLSGNYSGISLSTGYNNTIMGERAGLNATSTYENTLIGAYTGQNISNVGIFGTGETLVGFNAGNAITTGTFNTFVGHQAGHVLTTGGSNAGFGRAVFNNLTSGGYNTGIGHAAGFYVTTGGSNLCLGNSACSNPLNYGASTQTGSYNIGIGEYAGATGDFTNSVAIGNYADAGANNVLILGASSSTYAVNVGIGTSTPTAKFSVAGTVRFSTFGAGTVQTDALGNLSVSSDERLKNIDAPFTRSLADIQKLNPISYHWNTLSGLDTGNSYSGFSAQNVQTAIPEAVGTSSNGFLTLQDRPILATVVNAIKDIGSISGTFKDSLVAWLGGGNNGLTRITTDQLCVRDASGATTCLSKAQLDTLLSASSIQSTGISSANTTTSSISSSTFSSTTPSVVNLPESTTTIDMSATTSVVTIPIVLQNNASSTPNP